MVSKPQTAARKQIELRNILEVDEATQMAVRELRNQPGVRRHMYTDHVISAAEHRRWLAGLPGADRQVFVAFYDGETIGVVALSDIDWQHRTAAWAFYVHQDHHGSGLGSLLEYALLEYAFGPLGLEKLNCEVLATNPAVIRMHQKFGFVAEGVRRGQIVKAGERVDVHLLGILKTEWEQARPRIERVLARL